MAQLRVWRGCVGVIEEVTTRSQPLAHTTPPSGTDRLKDFWNASHRNVPANISRQDDKWLWHMDNFCSNPLILCCLWTRFGSYFILSLRHTETYPQIFLVRMTNADDCDIWIIFARIHRFYVAFRHDLVAILFLFYSSFCTNLIIP